MLASTGGPPATTRGYRKPLKPALSDSPNGAEYSTICTSTTEFEVLPSVAKERKELGMRTAETVEAAGGGRVVAGSLRQVAISCPISILETAAPLPKLDKSGARRAVVRDSACPQKETGESPCSRRFPLTAFLYALDGPAITLRGGSPGRAFRLIVVAKRFRVEVAVARSRSFAFSSITGATSAAVVAFSAPPTASSSTSSLPGAVGTTPISTDRTMAALALVRAALGGCNVDVNPPTLPGAGHSSQFSATPRRTLVGKLSSSTVCSDAIALDCEARLTSPGSESRAVAAPAAVASSMTTVVSVASAARAASVRFPVIAIVKPLSEELVKLIAMDRFVAPRSAELPSDPELDAIALTAVPTVFTSCDLSAVLAACSSARSATVAFSETARPDEETFASRFESEPAASRDPSGLDVTAAAVRVRDTVPTYETIAAAAAAAVAPVVSGNPLARAPLRGTSRRQHPGQRARAAWCCLQPKSRPAGEQ
jgi:hypothetical protein